MPRPKTYLVRAADAERGLRPFSHPWNPKSHVDFFQLGPAIGLARTGVNLARLAPGKESFVYHSHLLEEEWIYVLSGRGIEVADFPRLGKRMFRRRDAVEIYDLADGKPFGPLT